MTRFTTAILLLTACGCIWIAGSRHDQLVEMRDTYHLNQAEALENTPPLVAFTTVALGGFRGLLVDLLWVRLSRLQTEGKYFELVQLSDWITKLEPRSAAIWTFQAWNLSYNISVLMSNYEDRWRWVRHGVTLLRDEGLFYNRGSAKLYKELGWLFQHKIGSDSDQAHWLYKRKWYKDMDSVLNGPRPDYAAMHAIPTTHKKLMKFDDVKKLVEDIRSAQIEPFDLRWISNDARTAKMNEILARHQEGGDKLIIFLRKSALINTYKLDLEKMEALEQKYGHLDWRIPETQSLYWAVCGLPYAKTAFERQSLNRMIFQSLIALFQRGRFIIEDGELANLPDLDIYPYVEEAFKDAFKSGTRITTFDEAYKNFLVDAMMLNFYYKRDAESRAIFARIKELDIPEIKGQTYESIIAFMSNAPIDELQRHRVLSMIDGLLIRAYGEQLMGKDDVAKRYESIARHSWNEFMDMRRQTNCRARTGLPSFETLRKIAKMQQQQG